MQVLEGSVKKQWRERHLHALSDHIHLPFQRRSDGQHASRVHDLSDAELSWSSYARHQGVGHRRQKLIEDARYLRVYGYQRFTEKGKFKTCAYIHKRGTGTEREKRKGIERGKRGRTERDRGQNS